MLKMASLFEDFSLHLEHEQVCIEMVWLLSLACILRCAIFDCVKYENTNTTPVKLFYDQSALEKGF